jgi:hypothetical protein
MSRAVRHSPEKHVTMPVVVHICHAGKSTRDFTEHDMKKLTLLLIFLSLAGCASTSGKGAGNAANTDKTSPYDMTYRGGSL